MPFLATARQKLYGNIMSGDICTETFFHGDIFTGDLMSGDIFTWEHFVCAAVLLAASQFTLLLFQFISFKKYSNSALER